jgi:hypothetical protein
LEAAKELRQRIVSIALALALPLPLALALPLPLALPLWAEPENPLRLLGHADIHHRGAALGNQRREIR